MKNLVYTFKVCALITKRISVAVLGVQIVPFFDRSIKVVHLVFSGVGSTNLSGWDCLVVVDYRRK